MQPIFFLPGDPKIRELAALSAILRAKQFSEAEREFALEERARRLGIEPDGALGVLLGLAVLAEIDRGLPGDLHALADLAGVRLRRVH